MSDHNQIAADRSASYERSPVRLFVRVCRNYGLWTGVRVAFFRIRGMLIPALALPDPKVPTGMPHEVSVLLSTETHKAETIRVILEDLDFGGPSDKEACVSARRPIDPEKERLLARFRGRRPWIRIIDIEASAPEEMAARWAVEQATGRYIALVGPGPARHLDWIDEALERLRVDDAHQATALTQASDFEGYVQRKSIFLATFDGRWPLTPSDARGHGVLGDVGVIQ